MHALRRIHRAQSELQSHRLWLRSFLAYQSGFRRLPPAQSFATSPTIHEQANKTRIVRYKKSSEKKRAQRRADRLETKDLGVLSLREDLLQAVRNEDIETAINLYTALPEQKPLTHDDVASLAQCAHQSLRVEFQKPARNRDQDTVDSIVILALQLVKDIQKERTLPSTLAHVHLLGIFSESKRTDSGKEFWQWLEDQDEGYVNIHVYSVALNMLAKYGSSLEELEQLYQKALTRFPGAFFAYHLSPEAILPDREKHFNLPGFPMSLLQSIVHARLLRGDSRNAYLGLDTAFRVYPTSVPSRFFVQFQDERPVSESYTVFAMACRAGIGLPNSQFRLLLAKLREGSDPTQLSAQITVIRTMIAATYLYLGSTGTLLSNSMSELIIASTQIFRVKGFGRLEPKQRKTVVDAILDVIRKIMAISARYQCLPSSAAFNSFIVNAAGFGRTKDVLGIAAADMKLLGVEPNEVTRRSVLTACGLLKDKKAVEDAWRDITTFATPGYLDLKVFVKAAKLADHEEFARSTLGALMETLSPNLQGVVERHLEEPLSQSDVEDQSPPPDVEELMGGIGKLQADLEWVDLRTRDRPAVEDFSEQKLPMTLLQPDHLTLTEQEWRKLYDDLTTEGVAAAPAPTQVDGSTPGQTSPALSDTGISFGTLRYENWKTSNYLLWLAQKNDSEYVAAVDKAIVSGSRPPQRKVGLTEDELSRMRCFGLSENTAAAAAAGKHGVATSAGDSQHAREEVLRLRGKIA